MRKPIKIAIGVALVVGALVGYRLYSIYGSFKSQMSFVKEYMAPPVVSVVVAAKRTIEWNFEPIGTVESRQTVNISSKTSGRIMTMPFHRGDRVKKGDVLVQIDSEEARVAVLRKKSDAANARFTYYQQLSQQEMTGIQATTGISKAQADLSAAQAGVNKSVRTYSATLTQGKSQVAQAEARLVGSQASLRQAQVDFEKAKIHYDRMLDLQRQGFSSAADSQDSYQDVLSKKAALDKQKADVRASQADVLNAKEQARKDSTVAFAEIQTSRFTTVSKEASLAEAQAGTAKTTAYGQQLLAQKALVEAAEADLKTAEYQLKDTILRSPVDGYLSERRSEPGSMTSAGTTIVTVQRGGVPWIVTPLPQEVYGQITVGQTCNVTIDALTAMSFPGHIVSKDPAIDSASRQFNVRVQLEKAEEYVKPGMFARVKLEIGQIKDVLTVPTSALYEKDDQKHTATVYKVVKHKVNVIRVSIGPADSTYTIVTKGLEDGDTVVTETAGDLKEAQEVKEQPAVMKPSATPTASPKGH